MKKFKLAAVLLFCFGLVFSLACDALGGGGEEVSQRLANVVRGDLIISVSGSGTFETSREANLSFSSGGKLDKLYIEEGDEVTFGETLAELDTGALELALLQAQATRDEVRYNLNQLKSVLRASSDRVKIAELQLEAAERVVNEAQKQVDEAVITAPFGGVVTYVGADEGDMLPSPSMAPQALIKLIDISSLELEVDVDEVDIAVVELGQKVMMEVDALPELELDGQVLEIHPVPFVEGGVVFYQVTVRLGVSSISDLMVGMSATADIVILEHSGVLLIPERAVQPDEEGNPVVKVPAGEEFQFKPVVLGISDGFNIEVLEGLEEGEVVVVELRPTSGGAGGLFFGE